MRIRSLAGSTAAVAASLVLGACSVPLPTASQGAPAAALHDGIGWGGGGGRSLDAAGAGATGAASILTEESPDDGIGWGGGGG